MSQRGGTNSLILEIAKDVRTAKEKEGQLTNFKNFIFTPFLLFLEREIMKDLKNQTFGHLMAIEPTEQRKWGCVVWRCKCLYCGNDQVYKDSGNLQKKHDHNCGCHVSEGTLNNLKPHHQIIDLTDQIFGDFKVLYQAPHKKYKPVKWHCKCLRCGLQKDINSQSLREFRSRYCKCHRASRGQDKIRELLINNNIIFQQEKSFQTCKGSKNFLPFDFYINNEYLIEYDGQQHFHPIEIFGGQERFLFTQERDKIKTDWCLQNNIPLIRIPYTQLNNLSIQDLIPSSSNFLVRRKNNEILQ